MGVSQFGLVITIFLVVLSVVLIWDELRAERRAQLWIDDKEEKRKQAH